MTENLDKRMLYGGVGGASGAVWKSALLGASRPVTADPDNSRRINIAARAFGAGSLPSYRSGGLLPSGFAGFGNEILVPSDETDEVWVHETTHYFQYLRDAYGPAIDGLAWEQMRAGAGNFQEHIPVVGITIDPFRSYDPYSNGVWECEADYITQQLRRY